MSQLVESQLRIEQTRLDKLTALKKNKKGQNSETETNHDFIFFRLFWIGSKNFPQSNFSSENLSHFQLDAENFPDGSDFFISVSDIGIGAGIDQNPIDWKTKRKKSVIVSAKLWTKNLVIGRILWQGWCGLVEPIFGDFYALNNQRQNSYKKVVRPILHDCIVTGQFLVN